MDKHPVFLALTGGDAVLDWDRVIAVKRRREYNSTRTELWPHVFAILDTGIVVEIDLSYEMAAEALAHAQAARRKR